MLMSPRRAERSVQRQAGAGASFHASPVVVELVARVCMRERCRLPLGFLGKGLELGWIVDLMVYEYH